MRILSAPASIRHDPDLFFRRGRLIPHPEQAARYLILRHALDVAGHDLAAYSDAGQEPILAIHDVDYVSFLHSAWTRREELLDVEDEILSGHFARRQMHRRPEGLLGLIGYYTSDTSTAHSRRHVGCDLWIGPVGSCGSESCFGVRSSLCALPSARTPCLREFGRRLLLSEQYRDCRGIPTCIYRNFGGDPRYRRPPWQWHTGHLL